MNRKDVLLAELRENSKEITETTVTTVIDTKIDVYFKQ